MNEMHPREANNSKGQHHEPVVEREIDETRIIGPPRERLDGLSPIVHGVLQNQRVAHDLLA